MSKNVFINAMVGKEDAELIEPVFNYGVSNHDDLFQDYLRNMIFAGQAAMITSNVSNQRTLELMEAYPKGYGIRFENETVIDEMGRFCLAVITAESAMVSKKLKDYDELNPEHYDDIAAIRQDLAIMTRFKNQVSENSQVKGNGLRKVLSEHGKSIRLVGDEAGKLLIFVSSLGFSDDNGGDLIGQANCGCNGEFEIIGKIRGLQGAVSGINEKHFAFFMKEEDDLFIEESWFAKGKEKFHDIEHGRLIK